LSGAFFFLLSFFFSAPFFLLLRLCSAPLHPPPNSPLGGPVFRLGRRKQGSGTKFAEALVFGAPRRAARFFFGVPPRFLFPARAGGRGQETKKCPVGCRRRPAPPICPARLFLEEIMGRILPWPQGFRPARTGTRPKAHGGRPATGPAPNLFWGPNAVRGLPPRPDFVLGAKQYQPSRAKFRAAKSDNGPSLPKNPKPPEKSPKYTGVFSPTKGEEKSVHPPEKTAFSPEMRKNIFFLCFFAPKIRWLPGAHGPPLHQIENEPPLWPAHPGPLFPVPRRSPPPPPPSPPLVSRARASGPPKAPPFRAPESPALHLAFEAGKPKPTEPLGCPGGSPPPLAGPAPTKTNRLPDLQTLRNPPYPPSPQGI